MKTRNKKNMKTSYLEWSEYIRCLDGLLGDRIRLMAAFQGMCGLRVGDVLNLKWGDIKDKEDILIEEEKTEKVRKIHLNESVIKIIKEEYYDYDDCVYLFKTKFGNKPMTISWVNRRYKQVFENNNIIYEGNVSSHLFRKTFGRRYMELNDYSDKALIMLNEVYQHSTIKMTKIYLGIRDEEIKDVYKSMIIN